MNILFLGDIVGNSGCVAIKKFLPNIIKKKNIHFVVVNGENVEKELNNRKYCEWITKLCIDVITTGNHVWDQKETLEFIKGQRLLRPLNLSGVVPGQGFGIYDTIGGYKVGVLNLMGNVLWKCDDVFIKSKQFINENKLKENLIF